MKTEIKKTLYDVLVIAGTCSDISNLLVKTQSCKLTEDTAEKVQAKQTKFVATFFSPPITADPGKRNGTHIYITNSG